MMNSYALYPLTFVAGLALVALTGVEAAPAQTKMWIIPMSSGGNSTSRAECAKQVRAMYSAQGLQTADSRVESLQIGDFHMLLAPAGDKTMRRSLNAMPDVKSIQNEQIWKVSDIEQNPPFGLDRIDQRTGVDSRFHIPEDAGKGVQVVVIDTGVDVTHPAFGGRAKIMDLTGQGNTDDNGHGTHVCGTAAGSGFGIARGADVMGIKVFGADGQGSNTLVLRGLEAASKLAAANNKPTVINMSLGGPKAGDSTDTATQLAVEALTRQGVALVVAAGNEGEDACNTTPAFIPDAISVAASDRQDALASFSNYGKCTDIIAPGKDVVSAAPGGGTQTLSGTSMSSPHVAGVMAVLMSRGMSAKDAKSALLNSATSNVISGNLQGTPNRALFLDPRLSITP